MAGPLKLEIILSMVDKAMAPLRGVDRQSKALAASLKQSREALRGLERQQQQVEGIQKQQAALDNQTRSLKQLDAQLGAVIAAEGVHSKQAAKLSQQLTTQTIAYNRQRERLDELQATARKAGLGNLGAAQQRLKADIEATNASMAAQRARLQALAEVRDKRSQALGRAAMLGATGAAAVVAGRAAAAPVQRTLGAYSDQENAATQLKASMMVADGSAPEELQRITELATRLGDRLPGTTADFLEMMTMLKRQGLSAQTILGGTGEAAALLGVQLRMPVTEAAEFAAKMQDATQSTETEMLGLMDMIQRTFYLGVDSGNMLQGFSKMSPVLGILKQKGVQAANTLAPLLVMMDQTGMRGESAGNAIRKMFQAGLDEKKVGKANKMLAQAHAGFALSFTDKAGNFAGLDNLFAQLEKLKTIGSDTQRISIIKEVFGDDAENLQVINTIMEKGRAGYEEVAAKMAAQADLRKRVDVQLATLSNVLEAAQGSATNVLASIGETIAGDAKGLIQWLGDTSAAIGNWVKEHPALTAAIVRTVAAIAGLLMVFGVLKIMAAAVLGPFAMARAVFGLLGLNIGTASTALRGLALVMRGLIFTPMGLALTALAVAAYLLYTRWDDVRAGAIALWQDLSAAFAAGVAAVGAAFDRLMGWAQRTWQGITTTLGGLWSDVTATLATLPQRFFEFGANIIQGLANGITNRISLVRDAIGQAADGAVGWFKDKLGIRSPSRVFIEAGANIAQGAALGIDRTAPQVRAAALGMAAASLVALPAMALPAVGQPAGLGAPAPAHAPLASARNTGPSLVVQGDTVHLTIQAGAGVDPAAIAQLVRAELARHEQAKAARLRGAYVDYGN
ncbi:TP901 family phage tail tape measure protein [Pseudacidovorax intermedius]|uniref:TP901 family phage tail tape measure protein n=1 Tax=Pseudacidovorax intermedius TaxID=433924 RepID=A0A370FBY3_9BURK|nr:phage tail tape measure protein [Pseudacidovorax intermedius]RDI20719.1 TP901 family phage tail tape measure protein [Pseudacidovorax intermedius]